MKILWTYVIAAGLGPAVASGSACSLPAEEIVARYVQAMGGQQNLDAIRNTVIHGTYLENGHSSPAALSRMRPYYKLVGDPMHRSGEFEEGYDGSAWEFYGDPGIVLRTVGAASEAARHGAYILGNLVDFRKQGSTVTRVGSARVDGHDACQLRVRMMDGFEQDELVDAQTWLIVADRKVAKVHAFGSDVASETRWSDYRRVSGVLFAFRNREVEISTGKLLNEFRVDRIDVNLPLDVSMFAPPSLHRTPAQSLMDQLFQEREDTQAVLWTYQGFRSAFPDTDTDTAMQVIGYQMLKMGDMRSAIALLERNAVDYPRSSNAAFGLGRAYRSAAREADAKREFARALDLDPANDRARSALSIEP